MVMPLEVLFPGLVDSTYRVTSPRDADYNCVAWAAGDAGQWWWPGPDLAREFWPPGVPRELSQDAFQKAFGTLGYEASAGKQLEVGYEQIAIFADGHGKPTHAARQLPSGQWTSKLGKAEDIEHELHALEGKLYGSVVLLMKRRLASTAKQQE
jgi:hypothetical protein